MMEAYIFRDSANHYDRERIPVQKYIYYIGLKDKNDEEYENTICGTKCLGNFINTMLFSTNNTEYKNYQEFIYSFGGFIDETDIEFTNQKLAIRAKNELQRLFNNFKVVA